MGWEKWCTPQGKVSAGLSCVFMFFHQQMLLWISDLVIPAWKGPLRTCKMIFLAWCLITLHIIGVWGWVCRGWELRAALTVFAEGSRRLGCWGWISKAVFGDKAVLWGCTDGAQPRGTRLSKPWPLACKCWRGTAVFHYLGQLFGCTARFLSH